MAKRQQTLERNKDKVIALVLDGLSDAEVAQAMTTKRAGATRQGVTAFRKRHADLLIPAKDALVEAAVEYAIANQQERLRILQDLADGMLALVAEDGLQARDVKIASNGDTVGVTYFNAPLVKELRGVLADAASEKGERNKGSTVNIDNRTQVLIRQVSGAEVPLG